MPDYPSQDMKKGPATNGGQAQKPQPQGQRPAKAAGPIIQEGGNPGEGDGDAGQVTYGKK